MTCYYKHVKKNLLIINQLSNYILCIADNYVLIKGVDNVGARGALAPPDFQCVNMYKALNI